MSDLFFTEAEDEVQRSFELAKKNVQTANGNRQLLDLAMRDRERYVVSTQYYMEALRNLVLNNQYVIQQMLSDDMDDTDAYRDLHKATDDAMMILSGQNPYRGEMS